MIKFLMYLFALESIAAPWVAAKSAGTITLYHVIVAADDDGLIIQGMLEVMSNDPDQTIVLRFADAIDLQARAVPNTVPVKIDADQIQLRLTSADDPARLDFQYFRNWPENSSVPLILTLPPSLPVDTVMISLPIIGLKFETKGLKKTHLESQEVYTAFDLAADSDVAVRVYPPKPWYGLTVGRYIVMISAAILLIFLVIRVRRHRHE